MDSETPTSEHKLKNVTLRDVANHLGVSAMTVSRALSPKSHLVNAETARRCREAAHDMGYIPNLMARGLRGEQLQTIVMLAEHISAHNYLAELVDIVAREIELREFGVISCQSITSFHQALRNFKLAGAVAIAPPEEFYARPFGDSPVSTETQASTVIIHSAIEQDMLNEVSPDIPGFHNAVATHLLELGHRHLAYLGGPRSEDEPRWFELRRRGIRKAFVDHNVPPSGLHEQACADADIAPAALQQLLARVPETTAVLCINDEIAVAAIVGARQLGLEVPRDLSIVGCNDIKLARYFQPGLTTVAINIRSMVQTALELLFDQINHRTTGGGAKPIKIRLPAELIVRESTGPARSQRS
jgi:DNA-binding LacI/PurR family transcriptional regulator